ncbi:MAG: hypothetical protein AAF417_09215 [Pseudomonadota bacterium]
MSTDDETTAGLTVDERETFKRSLEALPETMPPRAVWERIEAQAEAEGLFRRRWFVATPRWLAGGGIAAAVMLVVLGLPRQETPPASAESTDRYETVPDFRNGEGSASGGQLELRTIDALMTQSQGLERDLRRLPRSPALTRASTAAAIDRLERQIAAIDYQLNHPRSRMTPRQQQLFWQERVRLMDSLLQLRYAELQRGAF